MIVRNEIRNRVISARPFTFLKSNGNIKIREMLMVEEKDRLLERGKSKLVRRQELLGDE